ncbi:Cro/CI family transcriptional regulator [Acidithiobacillus ferriphilus]|uniref:transcriptional regulator n=1 Tax=Acidithiobacillus ferriphilus TaxID=1689834 RepID=UPI00390C57E5
MSNDAIKRAIAMFGCQAAMARAVGVNKMTVTHWVKGKPMSVTSAIAIEHATKGVVKREDLLPEIFGPAHERFSIHSLANPSTTDFIDHSLPITTSSPPSLPTGEETTDE